MAHLVIIPTEQRERRLVVGGGAFDVVHDVREQAQVVEHKRGEAGPVSPILAMREGGLEQAPRFVELLFIDERQPQNIEGARPGDGIRLVREGHRRFCRSAHHGLITLEEGDPTQVDEVLDAQARGRAGAERQEALQPIARLRQAAAVVGERVG